MEGNRSEMAVPARPMYVLEVTLEVTLENKMISRVRALGRGQLGSSVTVYLAFSSKSPDHRTPNTLSNMRFQLFFLSLVIAQ